MAVKIRLKRMGAKKAPFYRVVVADPITNPSDIKIDTEKAIKWLNNGAIPTDTVRNILSKAGVMEAFHNSKLGK